ncbi:meiosis protein MEI2 [Ophiocordyceps camponoti-floridani]|uniref:Meiosis protein MEI2 n=1 Tax=Ophiocordyceps camponoti-floridani TaxID=2030778 RepID=A0A8H4Q6D4_9HYPO|nr:meiosis protein MEI2 [Ophiocordyceps camponoti-floridani]
MRARTVPTLLPELFISSLIASHREKETWNYSQEGCISPSGHIRATQVSFHWLDKDPFVTPSHRLGTRLSPTAIAFNPFSALDKASYFAGEGGPIAVVLSEELGISRELHVSSTLSVSISEISTVLNQLETDGGRPHGTRCFESVDGHVLVSFTDIRDSCSAYAGLRVSGKKWEVTYADQAPGRKGFRSSRFLNCHSGRILVTAAVLQGTTFDVLQAMDIARGLLQAHGQLFAFIGQSIYPNGSFKAIAEFCNVSAAAHAASNLNNFVTQEGIHFVFANHGLEIGQCVGETQLAQTSVPSIVPGAGNSHLTRAQSPFAMYPFIVQSPFATGLPCVVDSFFPAAAQGSVNPTSSMPPSFSGVDSLYHSPPSPALTIHKNYSPCRPIPGFSRTDARRQNAMRISRSSHHSVTGHHNHVDINRIRDGIDVRTTIMLRNIPNKVDQSMLKRIIDESSWGKYDFMYLRIDFANDCNVGYAFINFVDPLDIIDFVDSRGNQRWNCFKSDKVAEISYATIQGKDCLVQKFRNSSVMLEAPHYRPKLYFTCNGPMPDLAGQEESFPDPDNQSKMKRSCENAEHVGLFTPNAGQHFRDEQRRRRSQYDRGTRLAALEEYDYEAAMQHLYSTTK